MTEFLKIAFLAILQGVAEFLPVSSSGHLVLGQDLLHLQSPGNTLEIALHGGTLFSVCVFYGASISAITGGMLRGRRAALRYALALFVSMVPCGIAYAALGDWLEEAFDKPWIVGPAWLFTAVLMFTLPRASEERNGDGAPSALPPAVPLWTAFLTGLGQAVAMLPGVSRSGTTIWVARRCGLPASDAARFSFLMSLPVIGGATLLTLAKLGSEAGAAAADAPATPGWMLVAGAAISALVGYASLALLVRMLRRGRFWVFGVYCAIVGAAATLWYFAR